MQRFPLDDFSFYLPIYIVVGAYFVKKSPSQEVFLPLEPSHEGSVLRGLR